MKNYILRYGNAIFVIIILCLLFSACGPGKYLVTRNTACEIFDPAPVPGQILDWQGACENGYANGYGTLSVFENNETAFQVTGSMRRGKFEGAVQFEIFNNGRADIVYEEVWHDGYPIQKNRNLSLETALAGADTARTYLHRLMQYHHRHPDAWLDDFNTVLTQKVFFACEDISADAMPAGKIEAGGQTGVEPAVPPEVKKIKKHELFIKIASDGSPFSGFYTVFNHRPSSLKQLVSDRYYPGGIQFHGTDITMCDRSIVPETLPPSPTAQAGSSAGATHEYWYPVKRY